MRHILLAGVASTILAVTSVANAGGLINGSFEAPGGDVRVGIVAGSITGWTPIDANGSFDIYEADDTGDGLAAADGNHYVSFGHNGTYGGAIYQDLNTIVGNTYTVTYSVAEQQGVDATQDLQAIVQNGSQTLTRDNSPLPDTFMAGAPITFTATTGDTRLTFLDATPAGGGDASNLALDAVAVSGTFAAGGAPEPASWALMMVGLGGMGSALRSRRRATAVAGRGQG